MKYAEFSEWCNERACDGYWSMNLAMQCIAFQDKLNALPRIKREKEFQEIVKETNLVEVINRVNERCGIEKRYTIEESIEESERKSIMQKVKDWITKHEKR